MPRLLKNELAALGIVNRGPIHGYGLNKAVEQLGLEEWTTLSRSSIYNALRRLSAQGAVSMTKEREGNAPERSVYEITKKGRRLLRDLLRQALGYVGPEDRYFYLGITFAEALLGEEIAEKLTVRSELLERELQEKKRAHADPDLSERELRHIRVLSKAGIQHLNVELKVCQKLLRLLDGDRNHFQRALRIRPDE